MLTDSRFHSNLESEKEEKWLPMQVLETICSTPSYSEEAQVEIMKVSQRIEIVFCIIL